MKLLIIDDDKLDRKMITRALRESDHSNDITESVTAEEGLALVKEQQFDLILLDYQLPTMSGLDVLKLLKKSATYKIAVVILSNNDDINLALQCIGAGAQDFITKKEVTVSRLERALIHAQERFRIDMELRDSHEKLRQLAEIDSLTGLANRYMFESSLKFALPSAIRNNKKLALLFLDLDKFKDINDTLGHAAGDELLKEVALRLGRVLRDDDILCRLGGDEFAILIQNIVDTVKVRKLTERIINSLNQPYILSAQKMNISVSIGIATFPDCATGESELMKCADIAMYRAKESGRNQSHFYSKELHDQVQNRIELERDLQKVIERNELIIHYQPQIDYLTQKVIGVEALVRWQHPSKGLIPPLDFIPLAEDIGLINEIGHWVLRSTCKQLKEWHKKYKNIQCKLSVAINLSAAQLDEKDILERIEETLTEYSLSPESIELELTESLINKSENAEHVVRVMKQLDQLGITLALDDFGTGYSTLSRLQEYPFKVIKIDKLFIQAIQDRSSDTTFLKAISGFAKTLGFSVVAEGIETELQNSVCCELGFDRLQGFYYSKPVTTELFESQWLACL